MTLELNRFNSVFTSHGNQSQSKRIWNTVKEIHDFASRVHKDAPGEAPVIVNKKEAVAAEIWEVNTRPQNTAICGVPVLVARQQ